MRCQSSYQLARNCPSIDQRATVRIVAGDEIIFCCPVCANRMEERLRNDRVQFFLTPIGEEN